MYINPLKASTNLGWIWHLLPTSQRTRVLPYERPAGQYCMGI